MKKILHYFKVVAESFFGSEKRAVVPIAFSCALFVFYLIKTFSPASNGGALAIAPDSLEYSMGCTSLLESGRYGLWLDGVFHPSRYLPWFSAIVCLPAVGLFHGDIFAAVYSIWFCAAGTVALAFLLGRKNGSWMTGLCAASLLFLSPVFREMIRIVLTEIPYIFALFLMLAVWLKIAEEDQIRWKWAALYAVLTALAGAIRSSAFPMLILPWGFYVLKVPEWRKKAALTLLLLTPACLVLLAGFLYNHFTFGSGFRNGYQYWCPVPYDYPSLVFSFSYIKRNVSEFCAYNFFPVIVCEVVLTGFVYFFYRKRENILFNEKKRAFTAEILFALMQGLVLFLLYVPYFFTDSIRFFMPFEALLALPAVTAAEILLQKKQILLRGGMVLLLCAGIWQTASFRIFRFLSADAVESMKQADQLLPEDAVLVSDGNCALAEYYFVKRSARRYVPLSRGQEYVNKVIAPVPVGPLDPMPVSPVDHQTVALLCSPSCFYPYRWTVLEDPESFRQLLKEQRAFISLNDLLRNQEPLRAVLPEAVFMLIMQGGRQWVEIFIPNEAK